MISILTLNARIQTIADGKNQFKYRKEAIHRFFALEKPDIIGLQEVTVSMLAALQEGMPAYTFVGRASRQNERGEYTAIAYLTRAFTPLDSGTFWLSGQPEQAGSRFWLQSDCPRTCTWIELCALDTRVRFRYFNTHLDHLSPYAREQGVRVILEQLDAMHARENLPLFFGGDLNFTPRNPLYKRCLKELPGGLRLTDVTAGITTSFHWFGALRRPLKLDYLFADSATANGRIDVRSVQKDDMGRYISDHCAIRADWQL